MCAPRPDDAQVDAHIAAGILIDVAGLHGVAMLPDSYPVGPEDQREALAAQRTELRAGDVVLVKTGRMTVWPDPQV